MKRPKGYLSKHTRKLKAKRKLTPADFVREFKEGEKVRIVPYPYYKRGMIPHRRYTNLVGTVVGKRGSSYIISLKLGRKEKQLILLPIHLRRVG